MIFIDKHSCESAQRSNSSEQEQGHTNSAIVSEECKNISGPLHLLKSDSKQTASSDSDSSQGKPNSHFDKKEDPNNKPNVFKNTQHETIVSSKSKFGHPKLSDGDLSSKGDGKSKDDVSDQPGEASPSSPSSYSNSPTNSPMPSNCNNRNVSRVQFGEPTRRKKIKTKFQNKASGKNGKGNDEKTLPSSDNFKVQGNIDKLSTPKKNDNDSNSDSESPSDTHTTCKNNKHSNNDSLQIKPNGQYDILENSQNSFTSSNPINNSNSNRRRFSNKLGHKKSKR